MSEQTIRLAVDGMKCNGCVGAIEEMLGRLEGVSTVTVDLESKHVDMDVADAQPGAQRAIQTLQAAGFEARIVV